MADKKYTREEYLRQYQQQRRVAAYLKPKLLVLFSGYVQTEELSESDAINTILKDFFQRLPEGKRNAYLKGGE